MLKITWVTRRRRAPILKLEGELLEAWVGSVRNAWRKAAAHPNASAWTLPRTPTWTRRELNCFATRCARASRSSRVRILSQNY